MPFRSSTNIDQLGGNPIALASAPPTGAEVAPVVRDIFRRTGVIAYNGTLAVTGVVFDTGFIDTVPTGATNLYLTIFISNTLSFPSGGISVLQTDDVSNTQTQDGGFTGGPTAAGLTRQFIPLTKRYFRIIFSNTTGGSLPGTLLEVAYSLTSLPIEPLLPAPIQSSVGSSQFVSVSIAENLSALQDGATVGAIELTPPSVGGTAARGIIGVQDYVTTGSGTGNMLRTPAVFRGSQFSATGANVIWTPPSTKKVRLMKYKIEVGADATIAGGAVPINLVFSQQVSTTALVAVMGYPGLPYSHKVVVPSAAGSSFNGYDSDWVDFGNGYLLTTAGRALTMGIQVAQSTAAITSPAWTIASNQWEAATVGFKTNGNSGNFRLVQVQTFGAAGSSVAIAALQMVTGNSYFVFFRTSNPAGGAPTVTVTDTAGNTYTTGTLVTNASDSANGSSLGMAYVINAVGNAANIVTIATSTNLSTQIEAVVMEYAGVNSGGGIDAAQVGTTGNSTTPASGNYTPATAGDLVFTFMATAANLASQPTAPAAFVLHGFNFNAIQGAIAIADNFGNGTLATGQVNVVAIGTEE